MDDHTEDRAYGLVMPFVNVTSVGGQYDDNAELDVELDVAVPSMAKAVGTRTLRLAKRTTSQPASRVGGHLADGEPGQANDPGLPVRPPPGTPLRVAPTPRGHGG